MFAVFFQFSAHIVKAFDLTVWNKTAALEAESRASRARMAKLKNGAKIPGVFQNPQAAAFDDKTFVVTSNSAKIIFTRDAEQSWLTNSPAFDFSSWGAFYQTVNNEIALVTGTKKSGSDNRSKLMIRFGKFKA